LWARTAKYDSIQVGDELPVLVKHESQESINAHAELARIAPRYEGRSLHTEEEYARTTVFAGTVNSGPATVAYIEELLEKAFPLASLVAKGSRLEMRATEPIRPGDMVTFTGGVIEKGAAGDRRSVVCQITGVNQLGQRVAVATATIAF
jgi:acyl dehydratase